MNNEPNEQQPELWLGYNETSGYVLRPASQERAWREINDGSLSQRQQDIRIELAMAGVEGMTWKELGDKLGLHHGKISGALSNMHMCGAVFMLREQRDRCHPYVHSMYRDWLDEDKRYDEPTKTRNGKRNQLIGELLETCRFAAANGWSASMQDGVNRIVTMLDDYDNNINAQRKV